MKIDLIKTYAELKEVSEVYSEPTETSKMKLLLPKALSSMFNWVRHASISFLVLEVSTFKCNLNKQRRSIQKQGSIYF